MKSPEFAFKLVVPNSPQGEDETDEAYQARVARALIEYAKTGTKVDGVVTSNDGIVNYEPLADGKVKITVKITADNDTKLYFNINGIAQTPKVVNNLDTLTAIFTPDMPQDTWTIKYTIDGEPFMDPLAEDEIEMLTEVTVDCDDTFTEDDVKAAYLLYPYEADEDYDRGDITLDGKTYTVPYEYNKVAWTIEYEIDDQPVDTDKETYKKVLRSEPFEILEEYKSTEDLGYGAYDFEEVPELVRNYDDKTWTVIYYSIPTVNYFIGQTQIGQKQGEEVEFTADGTPVILKPSAFSTNDLAYKDDDFDLDKTSVVKKDVVKVWNVYFTEKEKAPEYSVKFLNNNGDDLLENVGPVGRVIAVPDDPKFAGTIPAYTTYTFAGWAIYGTNVPVTVVETIPEGGVTYIAVYKSEYNPPSEPTKFELPPFQEDPTPTPTAIPTPEPTPVPTEAPTPTEEPIVVEEPETPEGDVEIDEIETPEGAPEEEELDVEPIDTPQGDLPKTGVLPTYAFIGIGAACVLFGSILVIKRRKEEN